MIPCGHLALAYVTVERSLPHVSGRGVVSDIAAFGAPEDAVDLLDVLHEVFRVLERELHFGVRALFGRVPEHGVEVGMSRRGAAA